MLYTIKQYRNLFMNTIINKFEEFWDKFDLGLEVSHDENDSLGNLGHFEMGALCGKVNNISDWYVYNDVVSMDAMGNPLSDSDSGNFEYSVFSENDEPNRVSEEELRDLRLDEKTVNNLVYKIRSGDSVVITNDDSYYPTIQVGEINFILNWKKTYAYNNYAPFQNN